MVACTLLVVRAMRSVLPSRLFFALAVAASGCAAPAEEDAGDGAAAIGVETNAANRIALKPGSYAGKGAMLVVEPASLGGLKATISFDSVQSAGGHTTEYQPVFGPVQVGAFDTSDVSINDKRCPTTLEIKEDGLVLIDVKEGYCLQGKKSFRRQTPAKLAGEYTCLSRENAKARIKISESTEAGATFTVTPDAGKPFTVKAKASLEATRFAGVVAKTDDDDFSPDVPQSFFFLRGERFRWDAPHDYSDCDRVR